MARVLGTTERAWGGHFRRARAGITHSRTLVLFDDSTRSACGLGAAAMDRSTARAIRRSTSNCPSFAISRPGMARPGEFAEAYVIAFPRGRPPCSEPYWERWSAQSAQRARLSTADANEVSRFAFELQADCIRILGACDCPGRNHPRRRRYRGWAECSQRHWRRSASAAGPRDEWFLNHSRMGRPSSGWFGSSAEWKPGKSKRATRLGADL